MTVNMRVRIGLQGDYDPEEGSTLPDLIAEEKAKIDSGEWAAYTIFVEYEDPDREDRWLVAADVCGFVADAGLDGTYNAPQDVGSDYLKDEAANVWQAALEDSTLASLMATLTPAERKQLQDAASNGIEPEARPRRVPRLILDAGEIRDIWRALQNDLPFPMRLTDGTEIEVVAGDPQSEEIGKEHAALDEIVVQSTGL